jgi:hypothetical protein
MQYAALPRTTWDLIYNIVRIAKSKTFVYAEVFPLPLNQGRITRKVIFKRGFPFSQAGQKIDFSVFWR